TTLTVTDQTDTRSIDTSSHRSYHRGKKKVGIRPSRQQPLQLLTLIGPDWLDLHDFFSAKSAQFGLDKHGLEHGNQFVSQPNTEFRLGRAVVPHYGIFLFFHETARCAVNE